GLFQKLMLRHRSAGGSRSSAGVAAAGAELAGDGAGGAAEATAAAGAPAAGAWAASGQPVYGGNSIHGSAGGAEAATATATAAATATATQISISSNTGGGTVGSGAAPAPASNPNQSNHSRHPPAPTTLARMPPCITPAPPAPGLGPLPAPEGALLIIAHDTPQGCVHILGDLPLPPPSHQPPQQSHQQHQQQHQQQQQPGGSGGVGRDRSARNNGRGGAGGGASAAAPAGGAAGAAGSGAGGGSSGAGLRSAALAAVWRAVAACRVRFGVHMVAVAAPPKHARLAMTLEQIEQLSAARSQREGGQRLGSADSSPWQYHPELAALAAVHTLSLRLPGLWYCYGGGGGGGGAGTG
ncbi:hypothetical protein Agub_g373, partial [Astrephomene gubernaculifera]